MNSTPFWDTIWQILVVFVLVAYLIVLFQIIVDLFRDRKMGGFAKAIWFLGLIFVPFLTALLYILFRGRGMSERQIEAVKEARAETDAYIRSVAGISDALLRQLAIEGQQKREKLYFHQQLLHGKLPLSIGGGIGQSRLCMVLLHKAHIGEIQASIWPEEMRQACLENGMPLI